MGIFNEKRKQVVWCGGEWEGIFSIGVKPNVD